jgi:hypothetical protein
LPHGESINEGTHAVDYDLFSDSVLFVAALPLALSEAMTSMCRIWGVPLHNIKQLGVAEHALLRRYSTADCLCLPQENGVRLLFLPDGVPTGAVYVSDAPAYREQELDRLWQTGYPLPKQAILLTKKPADSFDWLRSYFMLRSATFSEETYMFGALES